MPRFSIVIPTWKNLSCLDLAVRSLRRHSAVEHEIIVCFNEADEACRQWGGGTGVQTLYFEHNLGVCGAVNRGVKQAGCDQVCFFNDDMVALPGWDTALMQYLGMADPLWLSGTAIEAGRAHPGYIGGQDYGCDPSHFREADLLNDLPRLRRPYNVVSTWTPFLLAKRDWDAVGGFDEAYFPGEGSDPDLAFAMYQHGCRHFIGVGTSLVYHFSRMTASRFDASVCTDAKACFKRKWGMTWKRFLRSILHRDRVITPGYPQVGGGIFRWV